MSMDEMSGVKTPLASDLAAGVDAISAGQIITFQLYQRRVLPLDGYVFWLKVTPTVTLDVRGSLHYATDTQQTDVENLAVNSMVFTALGEVNDFNEIAPDEIWIGDFQGLKFSFTARGRYYVNADLHHYVGNAVYADMSPQVIDSAADLDPERVIVSNSLPLWLLINGYVPANPGLGFAMPVTMYPAYLTPGNELPPFAAVDIRDETTEGLQATAALTGDGSRYQLATETVKVTLWGLRNDEVSQFVDCINAYSLAYGAERSFGIMNIPVIRDEKRTQSELGTLAMKKSVTFVVSYYQYAARDIARQLILNAQATFLPNG